MDVAALMEENDGHYVSQVAPLSGAGGRRFFFRVQIHVASGQHRFVRVHVVRFQVDAIPLAPHVQPQSVARFGWTGEPRL